MNTRSIFIFEVLLTFIPGFMSAQEDSVIPGNRIAEQVSAVINKRDEAYSYSYTVSNGVRAEQSIWMFWLILPESVRVSNPKAPNGWDLTYGTGERGNYLDFELTWGSPSDADVSPGSSLGGFSFTTTNSLPGIVPYYAEGYAPAPTFEEGMAEDSIPGYTDLTPYGPGVGGKTVGPIPPPLLFTAVGFLDTLVSYKHQCVSLGWLIDKPQHEKDEDDDNVDEGIVERLDRRLSKAREGLLKGDSSKARKELEKFLDKVEKLYKGSQNHGQKGEKMLLSSEGYALLRYNAEYLKEHLNVEGEPAYDLLPRNRAQVSIQVEVTRGRSGLEYHYYITSSRQSTQEADEFYIDRRVEDARTISAPSGWSFSLYPRFLLGWVNREESATYIHPGELRVEFACVSAGLPVIANYYVRGHNGKAPQVFHGEDVWYSDLTGNSAKGRTLGAAVPEQPLNPSKFLDGIIRQLQEAESLGWVRSGAIARAMEQKLRNVRAVIRVARGYGSGARLLGAMLEDLESQQRSFSTEGYALVKYNVEYLRDWLESHG
jgi:hypothetical protein